MKYELIGNYITKSYLEKRNKERASSPNGVYTEEPVSNFFKMKDNITINALDDIIESSRLVYGPNGGLYGESIGSLEIQDVTDDMIFMKSKDGHNYLANQRYDNSVDDAVLTMIKGYTNFIAEFRNKKSSKDGTTSLAILSALMAKNMLMARVVNDEDEDKFMRVPLSIENAVYQAIYNVGMELVDKNRFKCYDSEKREYLPNGFDLALKAISTTVDNNYQILGEFKRIMETNIQLKEDLSQAFLADLTYRKGDPSLEIELKSGINMRAEPIDNSFTSYPDMVCPTFIFQGAVSPKNVNIFEKTLNDWLYHLVNQVDPETGCSYFDPNNINKKLYQPVIILTRKNEAILGIIKRMYQYGIRVENVSQPQDGKAPVNSIKPLFLFLSTEDVFADRYEDIKKILSETIVNINDIDRFITTQLKERGVAFKDGLGRSIDKAFALSDYSLPESVFPTINLEEMKAFKLAELTYTQPWDIAKGEENYEAGSKVVFSETSEGAVYDGDKHVMISSYDGNSLYVSPLNDEQTNRMINIKIELQKAVDDSKSTLSIDEYFLRRVEALSSVSIYPVIYSRTSDEANLFKTMYEDALGVFISTHVYGVMPGGNISFIKFADEFRAKVEESLDSYFGKTIPNYSKEHRYHKFYRTFVDSILSAYEELFIALFIDRKEGIEKLDLLKDFNKENPTEFIKGYDLVRDEINSEVFEAAQTTVDNFYAALSFTKDILDLKALKFKRGHGANQFGYRIVDGGPFHKRNKELN